MNSCSRKYILTVLLRNSLLVFHCFYSSSFAIVILLLFNFQSKLTVLVYEASRPKDGDAFVMVSAKRLKKKIKVIIARKM